MSRRLTYPWTQRATCVRSVTGHRIKAGGIRVKSFSQVITMSTIPRNLEELQARKFKWVLDLVVLQASIDKLVEKKATCAPEELEAYITLQEEAEHYRKDVHDYILFLSAIEKAFTEFQ